MADRPTLLTTEQAAAILGASHFTLETWRWKRLGPPLDQAEPILRPL